MSIWQAIILGVVQGITEFLPISSSGHLILVPKIFGWNVDSLSFDVAIHLATLFSILVAMRGEIINLTKQLFVHAKNHIFFKLVVATVPVGLVGMMLTEDALSVVRTTQVVGYSLIVWGILLWLADEVGKRSEDLVHDVRRVHWWQALLIGIIQVFALIPGSSRSGVTISTGLFAGLDRQVAAKFSFLLAIPAIAGAGLLTAIDVWQTGFDVSTSALLAGFIAAFISGTLAIRWLLSLLVRVSFRGFAIYRIVLGVVILLFL